MQDWRLLVWLVSTLLLWSAAGDRAGVGSASGQEWVTGPYTTLQNGTWYVANSTQETQGTERYLFEFPQLDPSAFQDYMLFVIIQRAEDSQNVSFVAIVSSSSETYLGSLRLPLDSADSAASGLFCWSDTFDSLGPPIGYSITVIHQIGTPEVAYLTQYRILAALVSRQLLVASPVSDSLPLRTLYWYFDNDAGVDRSPVEITVKTRRPAPAASLFASLPFSSSSHGFSFSSSPFSSSPFASSSSSYTFSLPPSPFSSSSSSPYSYSYSPPPSSSSSSSRKSFFDLPPSMASSIGFSALLGGSSRYKGGGRQRSVGTEGKEEQVKNSTAKVKTNLLAVFAGCPGKIAAGNGVDLAAVEGTFNEKMQLTVSKGDPDLDEGRWYIEVIKANPNDIVEISVKYGMPYKDYSTIWGLTSLVFVLGCPAICLITLFLLWFAQPRQLRKLKGGADYSLLPEGAYESDDDYEDDEEDSDEGETPRHDSQTALSSTLHQSYGSSSSSSSTTSSTTGDAPTAAAEGQNEKARQSPRFWELTIVVTLIFFTPALQLLLGELLWQAESGNRDICFYNSFCERPLYTAGTLIYAFNNVYSNIGYLLAGLTLVGYLTVLRYYFSHLPKFMPSSYSVLWALALALIVVGINSAVYHLCPSRVGFQVDSAMMLGFALLSLADIWRRYFDPNLQAWGVFLILGVVLLINYIGTIIDTYPTIEDRTTARYAFLAVLTTLVVIMAVAITLWIWFKPKMRKRRTRMLLTSVLALPVIILLWIPSSDLSQTLLGAFVVLYALAVAADFAAQLGVGMIIERGRLPRACRLCPSGSARSCFSERSLWRRVRTAFLLVWFIGGWLALGIASMYYFVIESDSNKNLSPADSRDLNSPCVVADYYSTHDMWHLISAVWLLFQVLVNAHIGHGLKNSQAFQFD